MYSSFTLSDPVAYPLVLTGSTPASRPRPADAPRAARVSPLGGLATFARVQYVCSPSPSPSPRSSSSAGAAAACRFRCTLLYGLPGSRWSRLGPARLLDYYSGSGPPHRRRLPALDRRTTRCCSSTRPAWILVPGRARRARVRALPRPRTRRAGVLGAAVPLLRRALLLEAGFFAAHGSDRFQERYLFPLVPLDGARFGLALPRGRPACAPRC